MKDDGVHNSVRLTVDAASYSLATVDLAVSIAALAQTRLHGLFVEDEDLLSAAALPCSREITSMARARPLDTLLLQKSLRAMASQFQQYLAQAAGQSSIQWRYDYLRGRADEIGLKAEQDVAYSIVGQVFSRQPRNRRLRRVLLVVDHSKHLLTALQVVLHRFEQDAVELVVVKSAGGNQLPVISSELQALADQYHRLGIVMLAHSQLPALLSTAASAFDYAIISRQEPAASQSELLKLLRCPVILVA